jgi:hypothetical protein
MEDKAETNIPLKDMLSRARTTKHGSELVEYLQENKEDEKLKRLQEEVSHLDPAETQDMHISRKILTRSSDQILMELIAGNRDHIKLARQIIKEHNEVESNEGEHQTEPTEDKPDADETLSPAQTAQRSTPGGHEDGEQAPLNTPKGNAKREDTEHDDKGKAEATREIPTYLDELLKRMEGSREAMCKAYRHTWEMVYELMEAWRDDIRGGQIQGEQDDIERLEKIMERMPKEGLTQGIGHRSVMLIGRTCIQREAHRWKEEQAKNRAREKDIVDHAKRIEGVLDSTALEERQETLGIWKEGITNSRLPKDLKEKIVRDIKESERTTYMATHGGDEIKEERKEEAQVRRTSLKGQNRWMKYMRQQGWPKFDGTKEGQGFQDFQIQFERRLQSHKECEMCEQDQLALLAYQLEGTPRETMRNMEEMSVIGYDEATKAMREIYGTYGKSRPKEDELYAATRQQGETIELFVIRLQALITRIFPITEGNTEGQQNALIITKLLGQTYDCEQMRAKILEHSNLPITELTRKLANCEKDYRT